MFFSYAGLAVFGVTLAMLFYLPAWGRVGAVLIALFALGWSLVAGLGHPRPTVLAPDEVTVISAVFDPGEAIWIWTAGRPPISFELPWSDELAEQLVEGMRAAGEAGEEGPTLRIFAPGEFELHPPPQRPDPLK